MTKPTRPAQAIADDALPADRAARAAMARAEAALRKRVASAVALDQMERRFATLRDDLHAAHRDHVATCAALEDAIHTATDAAVAAEAATDEIHGRAA